MFKSHTLITEVGAVAESCLAKHPVINHIVPGNIEKSKFYAAQQDFAEKLIMGEDLMRIKLRRPGNKFTPCLRGVRVLIN